jgi:hypothetical protein
MVQGNDDVVAKIVDRYSPKNSPNKEERVERFRDWFFSTKEPTEAMRPSHIKLPIGFSKTYLFPVIRK